MPLRANPARTQGDVNNTWTGITLVGLASAVTWAAARRVLVLRANSVAPPRAAGEAQDDPPASASTLPTPLLDAVLVLTSIIGALMLLVSRWAWNPDDWHPIRAHVEGLLLLSAILGGIALVAQHRSHLGGLAAFILPIVALLQWWGVCASWWTYTRFEFLPVSSLWKGLHLVGVYLGTLMAVTAAAAAGLFLYVDHRLKHRVALGTLSSIASLETLERWVVRSAMLGFLLLTLGLITGVSILFETEDTGPIRAAWFLSPKVMLAFAAWLVYGLMLHIRHRALFRGRRAAILSIFGLLLLLGVYGLVTAMPDESTPASEPNGSGPPPTAGVN